MFRLPDFKHPSLLEQALTHKSFVNEHAVNATASHATVRDNERLEFLGDAILGFLCGEVLYKRFPEKAEGELTTLRSSLIDRTQLADFAQKLNLGERLRMGKGVEKSGGRTNSRLLSSAFEALIGAYFIDSDSEIDVVRDYIEPFFDVALSRFVVAAAHINYKSKLQEWALAEKGVLPEYRVVAEQGPDHAKRFTTEVSIANQRYGRGQGHKKQEAEKDAARAALTKLGVI